MLPKLETVHEPESVSAALKLLARPGVRMMPLYGGPELFDDLQVAAEVEEVILLAGLGLDQVHAEPGSDWRIGAMVTLAALPEAEAFSRQYRALPWVLRMDTRAALFEAMERAYPLNLRAMWTFGAVVAHAGASSPLLVTLLALDAQVEVAGEGATSLAQYLPRRARTDLVTAVVLPFGGEAQESAPVAYEAVARTPADAPIVCAAARVVVEDGAVKAAWLALGGAVGTAIRAGAVGRRRWSAGRDGGVSGRGAGRAGCARTACRLSRLGGIPA
ncbi:MAG: FAD binding domain-containing protein [Anaerolineae bacterium]|nr:FAD binding domain-containing protein [Anaerolineae bacterium]